MIGRRVARKRVRLSGRVWNDVAQELQEVLEQLLDAGDNGIPPGFLDTTPMAVAAGSTGDPGLETAGWAAADHEHPVNTATPSNPTGTAAAEGSSAYLMRSDATIAQGIVTTKGDVLGFSTVPARIAVGTDGQVLTADSTDPLGVAWADATGGGGGGSAAAIFDLVENIDVAAPATSVDFGALDGDTDEVYFLIYRIVKGVVAAVTITLRPNGLTTNQVTKGSIEGTGAALVSTATWQIALDGSATAGDSMCGQVWIDAKTGTIRTARVNSVHGDGTSLYYTDSASSWNETVTNITSIEVVSDVANGIGAGSYVRLYKLRKVAAGALTVGGVPSDLADENTEGVSTDVPRLDHQHKRDVRVQDGGLDVGTRNALNFKSTLAFKAKVEDDEANDTVHVSMGSQIDLRNIRRRRLLGRLNNRAGGGALFARKEIL